MTARPAATRLPLGHVTDSLMRVGERRKAGDLRYTAISLWLAAGLGSFEVARFMGTSVRMVDVT